MPCNARGAERRQKRNGDEEHLVAVFLSRMALQAGRQICAKPLQTG